MPYACLPLLFLLFALAAMYPVCRLSTRRKSINGCSGSSSEVVLSANQFAFICYLSLVFGSFSLTISLFFSFILCFLNIIKIFHFSKTIFFCNCEHFFYICTFLAISFSNEKVFVCACPSNKTVEWFNLY